MNQAAGGKFIASVKKLRQRPMQFLNYYIGLKHLLKESDQFQVLLTAIFLRNSQKYQRTVLMHGGKN